MPPTTLPTELEPSLRLPQQAPPSSGISRPLHVALLLALFCGGLFGTASVIDRLLPFPPVPTVKGKLDWFSRHGDEYDTLFIGSSRTFCHIIPQIFDRCMAQAGMPTHSFNLGINGMRSPEDTYLLEKALAGRKAPLKLVVVEANALRIEADANSLGTLRGVYWHDFQRFTHICRGILEEHAGKHGAFTPKAILATLGALRYNLDTTVNKSLNVGRGLEWLEARLVKQEPTPLQDIGKYNDGYVMYDTPVSKISEGEWSLLQAKLQKVLQKPTLPDYATRASQYELQAKRRLIESFGGQMITFAPPVAAKNVFLPDPSVHPALANLNFADPLLYPELFEKQNRFDSGHINQQGAEIFTRLLAGRIAPLRKNPSQR